MTKWHVSYQGRNLGTVYAESEDEAVIAAEDAFNLTYSQSDDLAVLLVEE